MAYRIEMTQSLFTRLWHWTFALVVIGKIISGLYLAHPPLDGDLMPWARRIHMLLIYPLVLLLMIRVYYGIVSRDWRDVFFVRGDLPSIKGLFRYIFFLQKRPPAHLKYNVGQKLVFTSWLFVVMGLSLSGWVLYVPDSWAPFYFLTYDLQGARMVHYYLTLWLVLTIPLHFYLALTEDVGHFQAMITGWIRREITSAPLPVPATAGKSNGIMAWWKRKFG